MKKKVVLGTALLIMLTLPLVSSYSEQSGIELDDIVKMSYVGTKPDGSIFDQNDNAEFTINYGNLIPGFVDGVLGMKIEETKTFDVPPDRGYQQGELAGITLTFRVTIIEIVQSAGEDSEDNSASNILGNFLPWIAGILGSFGLIVVAVAMNQQIKTRTLPKCVTCGELMEGTCSKCGTAYCRGDFGRKCKNCGNKTFIPE